MFRQVITRTPLTTEAADAFFTNITGSSYSGDKSFLATLRALMYPRMPKGAKIKQEFHTANVSKEYTDANDPKNVVLEACKEWNVASKDYLVICNVNSRDENARKACMDAIESDFQKVFKGWKPVDKVNELYRKSYRVLSYCNADNKSAILFVDNLNIRRVHYLGVCIMAILPWYFDATKGISDTEKKLLFACREKDTEVPYLEALAELAKQWDFEEARVRKMLTGFESAYDRATLESLEREVERRYSSIRDFEQRISNTLRTIYDDNIRLEGLRAKLAGGEEGGESELLEYFLCNKHLYLERIDGTTMFFETHGYLTYFNEDLAGSYIKNHNSFMYDRLCNGKTKEQMDRLWHAVFLAQDEEEAGRPVIKMRISAAYSLDLRGGVAPRSHHEFTDACAGYFRNPHIQHYTCIGQHQKAFDEMMKHQNYIGCLEQAVVSCVSISMHEGGVVSTLLAEIARGDKGFELPDGKVVNGCEAIEWLEAWDKEHAGKGA